MHILAACPICGEKKALAINGFDRKATPEVFAVLGLPGPKSQWAICRGCGFLFQNPRPAPEKIVEMYASGLYRQERSYSEYFYHSRYKNPKTHLQWCLRYLSYGKGAKILDIGAGHGGAVKAFRDLGFSAEGLELDPNLCAAAKDRFGVTLTPVDVMAADIPAQSNDLIYSSHVHEHFDNWQEVNQRLWTWLKPGGCLLVVVPTYRLSALNGRGFINVFHNSIFTRTSLDNMFKLGGFIPQAFHYPKSHSKAEVWGLAVKGGPPEKHPLSRDNAYLIWLELYCGTIVIEAIYRIIEGIARLTAPLRHRLRQRQLPHQTNSEAKKDNI